MRGFGAKFEEAVLAAFAAGRRRARRAPRVLLHKALQIGEASSRRCARTRRPTASSSPAPRGGWPTASRTSTSSRPPPTRAALLDAFAELDVIESSLVAAATTPRRARTHTGVAVDLRVVEPDQFGNLLQHFTGSKEHNMALREAAVRRGLHVCEYGLLDDATGETHRCATEEEVYALLGLPWIPPELREDRGELDARGRDCRS